MSVSQAALRAGGKLSALLAFFAVAAIAGTLVACMITPAVAIAGSGVKQQITVFQSLPSNLDITPLDQKARIYAKSKGKDVLLASFFNQNRDVIQWKDVSPTVKDAALAGEDIRFYEHGPIDPTGIVRALVTNARGGDTSGASTISQQYVKNVCIQQAEAMPVSTKDEAAKAKAAYNSCIDKSYNRKIREMRLAIGLEKKYDKNQILLGYLNIAGFGGRTYGIEAASEYYYGKQSKDLTVVQAASLMAIVNNPEFLRLDKKANLPDAKVRRDYILGREYSHTMITKAEYDAAIATKIDAGLTLTAPSTGCDSAGAAGFFCDYVVKTILTNKEFGKTETIREANLNTKGWKIYTSLNLDLQKKAQKLMSDYVPMKSNQGNLGGAAVSVQVGTGRVLTMVQNKVYDQSGAKYRKDAKYSAVNFNVDRTLGAGGGAQPGSTFKAFTLIGWLKSGHTINQVVNSNARTIPASDFTACGSPMGGDAWTFKNDENEKGNKSVQDGTAFSINGVFASLAEEQDLCDLRKIAESMGATNARGGQLDMIPAMSIGVASSIAPLNMAEAYTTIANQGVRCTPIGIDKAVDSDGKSFPVPKANCTRVLDKQLAIAAGYDLRNPVERGTMAGDRIGDGRYLFGKTGTTDNANSTWTIGSTTKVTTAVWIGNVNGFTNLRQIYAGPGCAASYGSNQWSAKRHCVFKGIQSLMNATYGGASSWPTPESQYLYGGKAIVHKDAAPQVATPKPPKDDTGKKDDKGGTPTPTPAPTTGTGGTPGTGNGGTPVTQ